MLLHCLDALWDYWHRVPPAARLPGTGGSGHGGLRERRERERERKEELLNRELSVFVRVSRRERVINSMRVRGGK